MKPLDQHLTTPKKHHEKVPQNSAKNNITTTSWKTCKPRQHHLGILDTHFIRKQVRNWGRQKKEHQQNRIGESEQVMSAGKWEEGIANPHNHRETPTEDRTGDDTFWS